MPVESKFEYIDDLNPSWPNDDPDLVAQSAEHHRGKKKAIKGSFPNLGQVAVTKTAAQINAALEPDTVVTMTNLTVDNGSYTGTQTGFNGNVTGNLTGNVTGNVTGNADTSTTSASVTGTNVITQTNLAGNSVGDSEMIAGAVQAEVALSTAGGFGAYGFYTQSSGTYNHGDTIAGSLLTPAGVDVNGVITGTGSVFGTWTCMGFSSSGSVTLWLRSA